METLLTINLVILMILTAFIISYFIYFIKSDIEEQSQSDTYKDVLVQYDEELSQLKSCVKDIQKQNLAYQKQIKSLTNEVSFLNNHCLNLYEEQNECWEQTEKLSNELETLRTHVVDNDKLNLSKFKNIASAIKVGKHD